MAAPMQGLSGRRLRQVSAGECRFAAGAVGHVMHIGGPLSARNGLPRLAAFGLLSRNY